MKTYEITAKVEIDEGVLDNFKAFGSAVTDLFTGDDAGSSSASGTASTGTASTSSNTIDPSVLDAAKKKIKALGPDGEKKPAAANNLDFKPVAVGKETLKGFKQWLRADGPGKVKFARPIHPEDKNNKDIPDNEKRTLPPGPQEYAAAVKRLYKQGLSLRALEVLKVWRSAASLIQPAHLAKIKTAAAAQAKAIGLN
tara:strand:- start:1068 stop:1658 length:591 start_codon:yes stop_codon:yes gene_type:complete